jgi:hypothetical protein
MVIAADPAQRVQRGPAQHDGRRPVVVPGQVGGQPDGRGQHVRALRSEHAPGLVQRAFVDAAGLAPPAERA